MATRDHPDWWKNVGGSNAQDSILERRSLISNDDAVVDRTAYPILGTDAIYKGKFYTRGCRGMIEELQIWRTVTAGGTITLRLSPHPCIGPLYEVVIPIGPAGAWTGVAFEQMWNYDSLFIWVHELEAGEEWGYDAALPYDGHESTDTGATWADLAIRPFIRAVMTGETPGDVPVSGVVNTIEIPSVALEKETVGFVAVPHNVETEVLLVEGAGTMIQAALSMNTSVTPTAGSPPAAVYYAIILQADGLPAYFGDNRMMTQSEVATAGRCSCGEFWQSTVAEPVYDRTKMILRVPVKFRRNLSLRLLQTTGVGVNVTGSLYVNQVN